MNQWTQDRAIMLCRILETVVIPFGCHVALTGGLLYKDGPRKDCDIIIYRKGEASSDPDRPSFEEQVDRDALIRAVAATGFKIEGVFTRVAKLTCIDDNSLLDLIFPECGGAYTPVGSESNEFDEFAELNPEA